uniref:DpnD/PcfM-like C-terminal domain-containing protein n=1 Tax=viral metagenome TaxID=1070528 RepID=A0A6M3LQS0_9ZZZZ
MKEYRIRVTETLSRLVSVETECEDDAIDLVQEQYTNEEIVLDETDFDNVEFEVD